MSRDVGETSARNNSAVHMTSFFGGTERGRCLQVSQLRRDAVRGEAVQMTEQQVREAIQIMQAWLED